MMRMVQKVLAISGILLLVFAFYVSYKESNPNWKIAQKKAYRKAYERVKKLFEEASDEQEKKKYEALMKAYRKPEIGIKQILLRTGEVERCPTCHVDELLLLEKHATIAEEFPFEIYGCTVCHGGMGNATKEEDAHFGLRRNRDEMMNAAVYAESPCELCHLSDSSLMDAHPTDGGLGVGLMMNCGSCHWEEKGGKREVEEGKEKLARLHLSLAVGKETRYKVYLSFHTGTPKDYLNNFWARLRELTPPAPDPILSPPPTFREYNITGEKLQYMGASFCLSCHQSLVFYRPQTLQHVQYWMNSKFRTFEIVKQQPDFQQGDEEYRKKCYSCHTTGYDPKTGSYVEENVTCEACHGPGEFYARLMQMGLGAFLAEQARKQEGGSEPVFPEVEYIDLQGKVKKVAMGTFYAASGATISRITEDRNICYKCHTAAYHEMRPLELEERRLQMRSKTGGFLTLRTSPP
ncbi:MAG: multiheme c-type cytochrome [bacterium JZ-2024 1]